MKVRIPKRFKKRIYLLLVPLLILVIFEVSILLNNRPAGRVASEKFNTSICHNQANNSAKLSCWQDLMDQTLNIQGLGTAFDLMGKLFQTEPVFAGECHSFAHTLGTKAYQLFADSKDVNVSPKSAYCGYGFYHGFMETLLQKTGDMNQARSFCDYAGKKLAPFISDAAGACYHGIGHGTVDGSDPRAWGDTEEMVRPALELCEKVSNDENPPTRYGKLFRCASGAFNALEILMDSSQYKLSPDTKDPFSICRKQPDKYREACYTQMVVSAIQVFENDHEKIAALIETIPEDDYAIPTLQSLVVERSRLDTSGYADTITFCRKLSSRFREGCITAYGEGFLKYGPPQKEYVKAVDFCSSALLTEEEKLSCFERILSILRNFYTVQKANEICLSVEAKYRGRDCKYI